MLLLSTTIHLTLQMLLLGLKRTTTTCIIRMSFFAASFEYLALN